MPIISISLPEETINSINALADGDNCSRSQIVREAVAKYRLAQSWKKLREEGDIIAKRLGIESDDDVELLYG